MSQGRLLGRLRYSQNSSRVGTGSGQEAPGRGGEPPGPASSLLKPGLPYHPGDLGTLPYCRLGIHPQTRWTLLRSADLLAREPLHQDSCPRAGLGQDIGKGYTQACPSLGLWKVESLETCRARWPCSSFLSVALIKIPTQSNLEVRGSCLRRNEGKERQGPHTSQLVFLLTTGEVYFSLQVTAH